MNNLIAYIIMATAIVAMVFWFFGYLYARARVPKEREDAIRRSRATLSGQFSEQLAPYLPDFPFDPTEAKFIGKPIDFLVFKGMSEKDISEVIFVEVKSGGARLTGSENKLREAIENKRVSWFEYRVPRGITKKQNDESAFEKAELTIQSVPQETLSS